MRAMLGVASTTARRNTAYQNTELRSLLRWLFARCPSGNGNGSSFAGNPRDPHQDLQNVNLAQVAGDPFPGKVLVERCEETPPPPLANVPPTKPDEICDREGICSLDSGEFLTAGVKSCGRSGFDSLRRSGNRNLGSALAPLCEMVARTRRHSSPMGHFDCHGPMQNRAGQLRKARL